MKVFSRILSLVSVLVLFFTGCQEYDDTEIKGRVDNLESQVTELRLLVEKINSNLTSLVTAVDALNNQDQIVSVEKLPAGNGYTITFKKSGTITIYNGEKGLDGKNGTDGLDGKDGKSPVISISQDSDGKYYWTLDGEWLLVNGQKVPATAEVTVPKIKVEDGKFLFSTNGTDWVVIGDAGTSGIGLIKNVREDVENNSVIIELSDREIVIPKGQNFALVIKADEIGIKAGETVNVEYSLISADNAIVRALPENGYTVKVNPISATKGQLSITAPSPVVDASILIVAVNGNGVMSGKILSIAEGKLDVKADATPVPAEGGSVTVEITTNLDYEIVVPEAAKTWITLVETKALRTDNVTFSVAQNTEATQRTAEVEVRVDGAKVQSFNIVQQAKVVVEEKWKTVDLKSLYQDSAYLAASTSWGNFTSSDNWTTTTTKLFEVKNIFDGESVESVVGLSGGTNAPGQLESPSISGGCKKLRIEYGYHTMPKSMQKGISINVKLTSASGAELYNDNIIVEYGDGVAFATLKDKKQSWERELKVDGNFKVTIKNNCPSNKTAQAYDTFDILSVSWISCLN
uniref:PL29 family lyase N-terminal domain-containing protein n=1 Tax=Candidatus Cryptobacteroides bacterium TaxID=3085639 RepID=UPI0040276CAF